MGHHGRAKPRLLATKLIQIRQRLGIGQYKMARLLNRDPERFTPRISEYESGTREPNLMILLAYSRLAKIPVEYIIDDDLDLEDAYD